MNIIINFWAVLVAAIISLIIGSVWYGPLFGKKFMKAMDMDKWTAEQQAKMKKSMTLDYIIQFVASLVMFYILAWFIGATNQMTVTGGVMIALLIWIGFIVPLKLGDALWGGKSILFWIGISNMLITLVIVGAVIGAWK